MPGLAQPGCPRGACGVLFIKKKNKKKQQQGNNLDSPHPWQDARTCKHLRAHLGVAHEDARCGTAVSRPRRNAANGGGPPGLLLAASWDEATDPTGLFMSEKLDGVRAFWDGTALVSRLGNTFPAPAAFLAPLLALPAGTTLDGELFCGRNKFNETVSVVKTSNTPRWSSVVYKVFDQPSAVLGRCAELS